MSMIDPRTEDQHSLRPLWLIIIMSDVADMSDTYWESCNSYVRSFVTFDEQLQHRLPPQMVKLELLANRQLSTEQRS